MLQKNIEKLCCEKMQCNIPDLSKLDFNFSLYCDDFNFGIKSEMNVSLLSKSLKKLQHDGVIYYFEQLMQIMYFNSALLFMISNRCIIG